MSDLIRLSIIGRCGKDPEQRQLSSGKMVCNVSIAASEKWKDRQTGEMRERTTWVNLAFWDGLAEVAQKYLTKGRQVYVEGTPSARAWKDKSSGDPRASLDMTVTNLIMLGSKADGSAAAAPRGTSTGGTQNTREFAEQNWPGDDQIPF